MKKILLTQRLIKNDSYEEIREVLDIEYAKLIRAAGFLPIILPYEIDFKEYFSEFEVDGILLTGGNDLNGLNENTLSQKRDLYEKALIKHAINNHIPIFGICRGLQIIAEYFGATFKKVQGQVAIYHTLHINENSRYARNLMQLDEVNSFHNFAVDKLGKELIVSGSSSGEIIKAIEHKKYNIFAQMWHSEREKPFNQKEVALIEDFFNEKYI